MTITWDEQTRLICNYGHNNNVKNKKIPLCRNSSNKIQQKILEICKFDTPYTAHFLGLVQVLP